MTRFPALVIAAVLAGCSSASIDGKLTDGMGGAPLAGVRIIAKATSPDVSLSCMAFEATTGEDGAFRIDGACTGTTFTLSLGDETWWVPDMPEVPDGGASGLALSAWRNASGEGLYELTATSFDGMRTHADVKSETILDSTEKVRFPWPSVPGKVPRIEPGEHLVLVGRRTVETYEIHPLIQSEARKFGNKDTWVTMDPWYYIGTRFTDDKTFERVPAAIDDAKVVVKQSSDRAGKYIPADALPAGRYVVLAPDSRAVTIVDFGAAPAEGG